jgi:hypothetical protein
MRKFRIGLIATSLLCLLSVGIGLAQEKELKQTINFPEDVMVGDTLVKKGTYEVRFDASNNELTILRGREVVARAKASVETSATKARYNSVAYSATEKGKQLTRLTFAGDRRSLLIDAAGSGVANK